MSTPSVSTTIHLMIGDTKHDLTVEQAVKLLEDLQAALHPKRPPNLALGDAIHKTLVEMDHMKERDDDERWGPIVPHWPKPFERPGSPCFDRIVCLVSSDGKDSKLTTLPLP